ncbi:MAG: AAA family ATPase [Saccharospirillum sp.]
MYLEHFRLQRHPFRMAPEDDFVYMSQQHSRAFVYMDSAVWSPEGFVVISGEIGSGKTTLLKKLMRGLSNELRLFHISYTNLKNDDLFHLIIRQAGLPADQQNKVGMLFAINDYLQAMSEKGIPVVLAVDEAQNLSHENLEDIRMLAGLEGSGGPVMRVILLGQPELKGSIARIPQLSQRVKLFFHLNGLTEKETGEYIDHRLFVAGYEGETLFDAETVKQVYALSKGLPRLINKLCDGLMLCAYAEDRQTIKVEDLIEIRHDLLGEAFTDPLAPKTDAEPAATVDATAPSEPAPQVDAEPTPEPGNTAATDTAIADRNALNRIASALERIDDKLERLLDAQSPSPHEDNVKPLPTRRR